MNELKTGDSVKYFGESIINYFSVGFNHFETEGEAVKYASRHKYSYSETIDECVIVHFTNGRMVALDELKNILKR